MKFQIETNLIAFKSSQCHHSAFPLIDAENPCQHHQGDYMIPNACEKLYDTKRLWKKTNMIMYGTLYFVYF